MSGHHAKVRATPSQFAKQGCIILGKVGWDADGRYLGVSSGRATLWAKKIWPIQERPADGEIWLDDWQREFLGVEIEDDVKVEPTVRMLEAEIVEVAAPPNMPEEIKPLEISEHLLKRKLALYPGFRFEYSLGEAHACRVERVLVGHKEAPCALAAKGMRVTFCASKSAAADSQFPVYDDIGGLETEIQELRISVEQPMRLEMTMGSCGVVPPRGVILYGPSGTGKTLLAQALAQSLTRTTGVELIQVSPAQALTTRGDDYVNGQFDRAEQAPQGAIVLIDAIDLMVGRRGGHGPASLPLFATLLERIDDLHRKKKIVSLIATTHRLEALDESLRRHGRFSREIMVAAPSLSGRKQILHIHTRGMPVSAARREGLDELIAGLARRTQGYVGADLMELCREAAATALHRVVSQPRSTERDTQPRPRLEIISDDFEHALRKTEPSSAKDATEIQPNVSFAEIAGLDDVIAEIKERLLGPIKKPRLYEQMGIHLERGLLLHGPPGTGKTMLAKAIAQEAGMRFLLVQGPELLSKWVGESEQGVRTVFARARQLNPCIIFFDEIEALLTIRGSHSSDSGVADRVVNQFLAELDGVVELTGVTLIGATNRKDMIDPAVLRPGRLGWHIEVPLPNDAGRRRIFRQYLDDGVEKSEALDLGAAVERLAKASEGCSGADIASICRSAKLVALRENGFHQTVPLEESHLLQALDESMRSSIFEELKGEEAARLTPDSVPETSFEDVAGLSVQVEKIREAIEQPFIQRSNYERIRLRRPRGILLFGPPGCGKTLIARAIANSLTHGIRRNLRAVQRQIDLYSRLDEAIRKRQHKPLDPSLVEELRAVLPAAVPAGEGDAEQWQRALARALETQDVDVEHIKAAAMRIDRILQQDHIRGYFLSVKGPEMLTKWVGATEERIRKVFESAKRRASRYTPVVIFFDEMESMFRTRGTGRSSDVETTIVPQLLAEMDGIDSSDDVLIIGATNRVDMIDPAIMRPGRLDEKIEIPTPDEKAAREILSMYLTPDLPLNAAGLPAGARPLGPNGSATAAVGPPPPQVRFRPRVMEASVRALGRQMSQEVEPLVKAIRARVDVRDLLVDYGHPALKSEGARRLMTELAKGASIADALIRSTVAMLYRAASRIDAVIASGGKYTPYTIPLRSFVSGAMLSNIVSKAKATALRRGEDASIRFEDILRSILDYFESSGEPLVHHYLVVDAGLRGYDVSVRDVNVVLSEEIMNPWELQKARPYLNGGDETRDETTG